MALLIFVLCASLVEPVWYIYQSLVSDPVFLLESHELITVLGAFLVALIGVELLDTIKAYFRENGIHVEIVVLLTIIAIARKVILLDPTAISGNVSNSRIQLPFFQNQIQSIYCPINFITSKIVYFFDYNNYQK